MSLADILQWVDATSLSGTLVLERATGELSQRIKARTLVAIQRPDARAVSLAQ